MTLTWDALNAKWNEWILGYGPDTQNSFMKWLGMNEPSWRKMLLTLVGLVIGIIMLISVVLMLRYRPPAKDAAAILYQRFVKKTGLDPQTGETPRVFATRIRSAGSIPGRLLRALPKPTWMRATVRAAMPPSNASRQAVGAIG